VCARHLGECSKKARDVSFIPHARFVAHRHRAGSSSARRSIDTRRHDLTLGGGFSFCAVLVDGARASR
jgi:hypothetical protein